MTSSTSLSIYRRSVPRWLLGVKITSVKLCKKCHHLCICFNMTCLFVWPSGEGNRRVITVRVWELHAPAAAVSWGEEHYPWGQELLDQEAVWQCATSEAPGSRCSTRQPSRRSHTGPALPQEVEDHCAQAVPRSRIHVCGVLLLKSIWVRRSSM